MKLRKVLLLICSAVLLNACNSNEASENQSSSIVVEEHVHTFSKEWSYDQTEHWHAATCEHTELRDSVGEHIFNTVTVPATYEAAGKETYTCAICGYRYEVILDKLEHKFASEWSYDEMGHWHECLDEEFSGLKGSYAKHDFDVEEVAATYDSEGSKTYTCKTCGYTFTETISQLEHHFSTEYDSNSEGHWLKCIDDGFEEEVFNLEEHHYVDTIVEATYDEEGLIEHTCDVCGYSYEESIDRLEHLYSDTLSFDETHHWFACVDEGYEDLYIEKEEHHFINTVVEPTYEEEGYTIHQCEDCEYSYTDTIIERLEHHYSDEYQYDGSTHWHPCIDEGYTHLKADEETHHFVPKTVVEPTFTEYGYTILECTECGATYKRIDEYYKEHTFSDDFECNEEGHWHRCVDEGYDDLTSDIEEHEYGNYVIDYIPENTNEEGLMHKECKHCGYKSGYRNFSYESSHYFNTSYFNSTYYGISSYYGGSDIVVIPENVDGYEIGCLGEVFSHNSSVKEVILPNTLRWIWMNAFYCASSIESLYIPDGVTEIGYQAFYNSSIKEVHLPTSLQLLNSYCFEYCSNLKNVVIPNFDYAYDYCFAYCNSLESISINGNNASIGYYFCQNCPNLETVIIKGVTSIGEGAFYSCQKLKNLSLPASLDSIGYYSFYNCESLETVILPDGITYLGYYCFAYCTNLKTVVFPKTITGQYNPFGSDTFKFNLYYTGSEDEWSSYGYTYYYANLGVSVYFYSKSYPLKEGNYWHYVKGVPTAW